MRRKFRSKGWKIPSITSRGVGSATQLNFACDFDKMNVAGLNFE